MARGVAAGSSRKQDHAPTSGSDTNEATPLLHQESEFVRDRVNADDIDSRFRRWKQTVAHRMRSGHKKLPDDPTILVSVFDGESEALDSATRTAAITADSLHRDVEGVRLAIEAGILPKMITTGSSGSYFARLQDARGRTKICGVFKPADEEPYGNLNPKRAFLRKYFWFAMGRPCLIAGFSAMSEAGASLLDDRLQLGLVPATRLVNISSPSFHYSYTDRMAFEHHGQALPEKTGSFQSFLHGYTMASTFLRSHPFPTRPRSVLERDLAAEQRAHRKSRKQYSARLRKFGVKLKYICLCRQGLEDIQYDAATEVHPEDLRQEAASKDEEDDDLSGAAEEFLWTPELIQAFRLELEKLVVFDYLCRNTDRGLDNFMVKYVPQGSGSSKEATIHLGAIDNSLAWPIKHPDGIREYPFGWLYLPADIIGGPFAKSTGERFLPMLSSAAWWRETEVSLRELFQQDEHFNPKLFESQMAVFKGQGWNLVQSLQSEDEGPLELCARPKKVVHQSISVMLEQDVNAMPGGKVMLQNGRPVGNEIGDGPRPEATTTPTAVSAKPIPTGRAVPTAGTSTSALPASGAHPASLPETSNLILARERDGPAADGPADASAPVKPGSLGIEVVEAMSRAARGTPRKGRVEQGRPPLTKAQTGLDGMGRSSAASGHRWGRHNSRRYGSFRPSTRRYGSAGGEGTDILSEDEEDQEEGRDGAEDLAQSLLSEPDVHRGPRDSDEQAQAAAKAQERMASSDYFASYHSRGGSGGGGAGQQQQQQQQQQMPSIAAQLERSETDGGARGRAQEPLPEQRPSRRRMRSVGQWSISSIGSLARGYSSGGGGGGGGLGGDADTTNDQMALHKKVKVIIERLVEDNALPWQAWLRA